MSDETADQPPPPEESDSGSSIEPAETTESSNEAPNLGQGQLDDQDEKTFALLVHLLGGFTLLIGPLVIWMMKREESPFIDDQGKESINWQVGVSLVFLGLWILIKIPFIVCLIWPLFPVVGVVNLILCLMAGIEANRGKVYRYPYNLRLIK